MGFRLFDDDKMAYAFDRAALGDTPIERLAERFGVSVEQARARRSYVRNREIKRRYHARNGFRTKKPRGETTTYTRNCLSCRAEFTTPSRFIRLCARCKGSPDYRAGEMMPGTGN